MENKAGFQILNRKISPDFPPFIIAEMSANHNGNLSNALNIVRAASKAGAEAIKLQTYTADTMTLNSKSADFQITDGLWAGKNLYDLYKEAHLPWEWHKPIMNLATDLGLIVFSTPFDKTAVDFLEDLNVPAYKIASFEATDLPLIQYVASTRKPMIISTGLANEEEIQEAVETALQNGCSQLALLHCVSSYPAPAENYNLKTIPDMAQKFKVITGLSDHTIENATAITSIAMGASIIEKHFTLDRNGGGADDSFSLEPAGLTELCASSLTAWQALGKVDYGLKSSEEANAKFRRSLYFARPLKSGDTVTEGDIRCVRPGYGLPPKYLSKILGKTITRDIESNTATKADDFEQFEI